MKPLHLAIGIFDGVHKGHHYLIHSAVEDAQKAGVCSGALTFHPHPKQVLHRPDAPQLIYPIQHRYWLLKKLGCDFIFIKKFTELWSHSTPNYFFAYLKRIFPTLSHLYVGEDFHFGYKRMGDVQTLQILCQENAVQLHIVQSLKQNGEKICSTRIRKVLKEGLVSVANQLLYIPYHCIGYITPAYAFKHHCELRIKDGIYDCRIVNKQFKQDITLQVKNGLYQIISMNSVVEKTACLLQFKRELDVL